MLAGRVPAAAFAGRVAVVGTTAAGLKDMRATPLDPVYPGAGDPRRGDRHHPPGDFLLRPRSAHGWELLAALLAGA